MPTLAQDALFTLLPDVPGKVHGIVHLDPPTIQCDGCGRFDTWQTLGCREDAGLSHVIILSRIRFNPRLGVASPRLCRDCAKSAGWAVERCVHAHRVEVLWSNRTLGQDTLLDDGGAA